MCWHHTAGDRRSCGRQKGADGDPGILSNCDDERQTLFRETLDRVLGRRKMWESKWERLEEILPERWLTLREYCDRF